MHGALTFAEAFRGIVSNISMALLLGLIAIAVIAWMVKTMATPMRKLLGGGIVRVALAAAMVWTGIVESFSKHTNDPPRSVASITPEDISNGWRMVETRDGCAFSRAHDGTCAIHEPWLVRGGFGDVVRISANGWFFPWRDGFADELIVFSDGEIRPNLRTSFFPRPFDVPLAVVPAFNWHQLLGCASNVFWHVSTPSNSIVVAWENAPVNRDANILTNFQAEFFADGRFAYRYDDRMVDYSPVFPFDWDNDGLANSVDPDPLVAGPDAHGTNAEWYNTVCSNIVNSNAYYFVDIVAERGPAPIRFTGDRACRLGNLAVVALAGETNRVPLLIGINYAVTSDTPFTVSFPVDYPYVEVETNEPCVARIRWPLGFEFTESIGPSNRTYAVTVVPYDPGGEFSWGDGGGVPMRGGTSGGGCSCVSYDGHGVVFSCTEQCPCAGTCLAVGTYSLENASFPFSGGECRCGFDDPEGPEGPPAGEPSSEPSLSVSFSKDAVIFEDTYEDKPGVWRPKRSNRVRLTVSASGGSLGGVLTLATANLCKLSPVACGPMLFPPSMELAPYDVYCASFLCEGNEESDSTGDVSVSGTFVENGTGETFHSNDRMTVFRIELEPIVSAPANACVHRHKMGVGEVVKCRQWPAAPVLSYAAIGEGVFSNATDRLYVCPLQEEFKGLRMSCGNVEYKPLLEVIEPEEIECTECVPLPVSPLEGVGMRLELRVLPYDVSFVGIALQEVPSLNGTHTGYFAQSCYQHRWYHTVAWGAGEWKSVTDGNLWGYDHSRMFRWDQPWDRGTLAWEIPIGWNRAGTTRGACFKQKDMNANSCWDMQPYVITKTKHWQVLSLGTDGSWMLNGENCDE